jgi:hypothetical protein
MSSQQRFIESNIFYLLRTNCLRAVLTVPNYSNNLKVVKRADYPRLRRTTWKPSYDSFDSITLILLINQVFWHQEAPQLYLAYDYAICQYCNPSLGGSGSEQGLEDAFQDATYDRYPRIVRRSLSTPWAVLLSAGLLSNRIGANFTKFDSQRIELYSSNIRNSTNSRDFYLVYYKYIR